MVMALGLDQVCRGTGLVHALPYLHWGKHGAQSFNTMGCIRCRRLIAVSCPECRASPVVVANRLISLKDAGQPACLENRGWKVVVRLNDHHGTQHRYQNQCRLGVIMAVLALFTIGQIAYLAGPGCGLKTLCSVTLRVIEPSAMLSIRCRAPTPSTANGRRGQNTGSWEFRKKIHYLIGSASHGGGESVLERRTSADSRLSAGAGCCSFSQMGFGMGPLYGKPLSLRQQ